MLNRNIGYLVISDIHLGHRRNNTAKIIDNLKKDIDIQLAVGGLDIVFLAGDVFDGLLTLASSDVTDILQWIDWLGNRCAKHNVAIRVLEGTPSHDWKQSTMFDCVLQIAKAPVDFGYIKTLSIEQMPDTGLTVLYVPDEWSSDTNDTYQQVLGLLNQHGLKSVDIAIMHGQFGYQLPAHVQSIPRHNEEDYLQIVSRYISIGHVHKHSVCKRIIAQGSFDRLSHNEEEDKGLVRIHLNVDPSKDQYYFIPNTNATIFKTITLPDGDLETAHRRINKAVVKLPNESHVRIRAKVGHPFLGYLDQIKKDYPFIHWSKIATDDASDSVDNVVELGVASTYIPITITATNIVEQVMGVLSSKGKLTGVANDQLARALEDIIR